MDRRCGLFSPRRRLQVGLAEPIFSAAASAPTNRRPSRTMSAQRSQPDIDDYYAFLMLLAVGASLPRVRPRTATHPVTSFPTARNYINIALFFVLFFSIDFLRCM
jgi:hypothetical protein